jgi:hypothetical protein
LATYTTETGGAVRVYDEAGVLRFGAGDPESGTDFTATVNAPDASEILTGVHDMFRIVASGTLNAAWGGNGTSTTTTVALPAIGSLSTPLTVVWEVTEDVAGGVRSPGDLVAYDGAFTMSRRVLVWTKLTAGIQEVSLYIENRNSGALGGITASARFFVLAQEGV